MGCDIHLAVEVRGGDGAWHRVHPPPEARSPWLVEQAAKPAADEWYRTRAERVWYDTRNYDAFAILAGVCNGSGFAGIQTGQGFVPIAEPRGLPGDMSPEVSALADPPEDSNDVWLGDHSHSWLTLAELEACDWARTAYKCGVIPWADFLARGDSLEPPSSYCGGISGPSIVTIEEGPARAARASGDDLERGGAKVHVCVWWPESYAEAAGDLHTCLLPALRGLGANPGDVRIVFGFDS